MRFVCFSIVSVLVGCSSTSPVTPDASPGDAAIAPDSSAPPDASSPPDAGPVETGCFDDVELVTAIGVRASVVPVGLFERNGGWLAIYQAHSHGDSFERAAVFLDREGRVTARQALDAEEVVSPQAVLGRFLLSSLYDVTRLYEMGDGELVDRSELLGPLPGRIVSVQQAGDRLRVLSAISIDTTGGSYRFAYSEIVLGEDGSLTTLSAELPPVESLGAESLTAGLGRYHGLQVLTMHEDTLVFAFATGEREHEIEGHPWNVVHVALDRSRLADGVASWSVVDEMRWEEGPISVFGALPDLGYAIVGRWRPIDESTLASEILAERFDGTAAPILLAPHGDFPRTTLGPTSVVRRGDRVGLISPNRLRVRALPGLEETASAPIELPNALVVWGEDTVLELGSLASDAGVVGLVRCHELATMP